MIPSVDVKFLRTLTASLAKGFLTSYLPSTRRSTAALILRFSDQDSKKVSKLFSHLDAGISATEAISRLERNQDENATSSLQLLFLKRADIRDDRWSGRIAFPGGFRDVDDRSDMDALVREVHDEIGFPLRSPDFILLGKMNDYGLKSRVLSRAGIVQSRYVFLFVGELTPSVRINQHHIEAMQWVSLNQIRLTFIDKKAVMHVANKFMHASTADQRLYLRNAVTFDVFFPSVKLPGKWRIWGLTFYNTSELFELAGGECLCWPLFDVSCPPLRPFVYALHGFWELQDMQRRPITVRHQMWLGAIGAFFCGLVYGFCTVMFFLGMMVREMTLRERVRLLGPPLSPVAPPVDLPAELPELPVEYDSAVGLLR